MRLFLFFLSLALFTTAFTEPGDNTLLQYKQEIDQNLVRNKVLITFTKDLSAQEKNNILENSGVFLSIADHLSSPDVSIVYLQTYLNGIEDFLVMRGHLSKYSDILSVTPLLKASHKRTYGVLPTIHLKMRAGKPDNLKGSFPLLEGSVIELIPNSKSVYRIESNEALELAIQLNQHPDVLWAEPDYLLSPVVTSNDPIFSRQWAHVNDGSNFQFNGEVGADMDVDSAWTITRGDSSIVVAILDSGVDTLHEDLLANLFLPGFDGFGEGTKGYPTPNFDSDGHGTACAGIVAAVADNNIGLAGVAPNCKILPVRIFYYADTLGQGVIPLSTASAMAAGINWATQNGADLMSNSWGLPSLFLQILPGDPMIVEDAIEQAVTTGRGGKGCPMFFSSGNEDTPPIWPSKLATTIAINATSMCDERKFDGSCDGETWTGCWGEPLDFSAPGVKIAATDMTGGNGYRSGSYFLTFNGTSAACPNAAGVGALLLSFNPDLLWTDVQYLMAASAEKVGGYSYDVSKPAGMWSEELGYGRVNAFKALQLAQTYNVSITSKTTHDLDWSIYPNPSIDGMIRLELPQTDGNNWDITFLNSQGVQVKTIALNSQSINSTISTDNLPSGVYYVQLKGNDADSIRKLIVF